MLSMIMCLCIMLLLQEAIVWVCLSSQLTCLNQLAYNELLFFEIVTVFLCTVNCFLVL